PYAAGLVRFRSSYRHLEQYVCTHRPRDPVDGVVFTDRHPAQVVRELKAGPGKDIWLCGGGSLAAQLVDEIDRLVLKRQPLLFGSGIPLLAATAFSPRSFDLVMNRDFGSGVSIAEYRRRGGAGDPG